MRSVLRLIATCVAAIIVIYGAEKIGFTDDVVRFVDYMFAYRP